MKSLLTLVKLHKNKLNEILHEVEKIESKKSSLIKHKTDIKLKITQESNLYATSNYSYMLDNYISHNRKILSQIDFQIQQFTDNIAALRLNANTQYSEVKKFEIVLKKTQQEAIRQQEEHEAKELNEISINRFVRKEDR